MRSKRNGYPRCALATEPVHSFHSEIHPNPILDRTVVAFGLAPYCNEVDTDLYTRPSIHPVEAVPPELVLGLGQTDVLVRVVVVEDQTEVLVLEDAPGERESQGQ